MTWTRIERVELDAPGLALMIGAVVASCRDKQLVLTFSVLSWVRKRSQNDTQGIIGLGEAFSYYGKSRLYRVHHLRTSRRYG